MKTKEFGSTLVGFLGGLITGLLVAVVVAMYITKAPIPFSNKSARPYDANPQSSAKPGQDPNLVFYPKQPAGSTDAGDVKITRPDPVSRAPEIAVRGQEKKIEPGGDEERVVYLLQVGAFKNQDDADNMKAKLALFGAEAKISSVEVDGRALYRVRLGPYRQQNEMLSARKQLSENGIEGTVVKQKLGRE